MRLNSLFVAMLLVALPLSVSTQTADTQPDSPVFRVTTRLVVLDAVVTDSHGKVVVDQTKDDFTVREDGVTQQIRNFEIPSQHVLPQTKTPIVKSSSDLKKTGDAPLTILVIDELNTQFADEAYARQQLVAYLKRQPEMLQQPTTLLAVTNTKCIMLHDYTQDRGALLEIVQKHLPEFPWKAAHGSSGDGLREVLAQSMSALLQIAQASMGYPGRKNLVWIGKGFPAVDVVPLDQTTAATLESAVRRVTDALLAARITFYGIDPVANSPAIVAPAFDDNGDQVSPGNIDDPFAGQISFASFAPATGGTFVYGRNDIESEIASSIDRGAKYYTLSYSPTSAADISAKYRKISIQMRNPNLHAITRSGYYVGLSQPVAPGTGRGSAPTQERAILEMELSNAALSTMSYSGLEVNVSHEKDGILNISVPSIELTWRDTVDDRQQAEVTVLVADFNNKGRLIGHVSREITALRDSSVHGIIRDDTVFRLPFNLPADTTRLRIVVRDAATGKLGTANPDVK
jgi:VWFA-related protein